MYWWVIKRGEFYVLVFFERSLYLRVDFVEVDKVFEMLCCWVLVVGFEVYFGWWLLCWWW